VKTRRRAVATGLVGLAALAPVADAARFPDSVARRFSVTGEAARAWAVLLGLDPAREARVELPLSGQHRHAVGLRTGGPVDPAAARNVVRYDPGPPSRLTLDGEWLDSTTGSRIPVPRYTVGSDPLAPAAAASGAWDALARHLDMPRLLAGSPAGPGALLVERSSDARQLPWLRVAAYRVPRADGQWAVQLEIGVDERPAAARARALAEFSTRQKARTTLD
jgi:hypothetical protein